MAALRLQGDGMKRRQCRGEAAHISVLLMRLFEMCLAQCQQDLTPPLTQNDCRSLNAPYDPPAFERFACLQKSGLTADRQDRHRRLILHDALQFNLRQRRRRNDRQLHRASRQREA